MLYGKKSRKVPGEKQTTKKPTVHNWEMTKQRDVLVCVISSFEMEIWLSVP